MCSTKLIQQETLASLLCRAFSRRASTALTLVLDMALHNKAKSSSLRYLLMFLRYTSKNKITITKCICIWCPCETMSLEFVNMWVTSLHNKQKAKLLQISDRSRSQDIDTDARMPMIRNASTTSCGFQSICEHFLSRYLIKHSENVSQYQYCIAKSYLENPFILHTLSLSHTFYYTLWGPFIDND